MSNQPESEREGGVAVEKRTERKRKRPRLFKVLFHNDDFTTQEFVVAVLQQVFHHSESTAAAIMLNVHRTGIGIAGIYTFEIAETRVAQTMELAQKAEFPLQVTLEPEDGTEGDGDSDGKDES
ncbi:MAG: ATP-dependent Clp protease adaptor ClpS [Myxococcales bacterium]|nr:ATP-dependent Clp protease adaptor ClpS [Myxococcales bacterium]